ncbi:MAG TPA: UDP-N-acetylmuramoyl-L-alanyl-D-glutamate--2,6-diaminopimelate ligase [Dongiaceae bacterium]|jgi:UDP-N-acetylmuramoyl-L-alanyl-D-glutamate--2,6-diaminopimelate ligase|nr:UDP-N-acetylmuramoyl-L-alanyl-D-glutamate--2,6-diaminopimelate ligase [Dongiaceae bacterium]
MLNDLVAGTDITVRGAALQHIIAITSDSRDVGPKMIFAAIPGHADDGGKYLSSAAARGAGAFLVRRGTVLPEEIGARTVLETDNVRRALALIAARLFRSQPAVIAAVTGTSGKTSVASFTRQLWQATQRPAASIGTLGIVTAEAQEYGALTTPDPVVLHRQLADLASKGIEFVALEASSHGLDQHRLDGVHLSAGAFTNLSHDHLDYHGTEEQYFLAKRRLFDTLLPTGAAAIINTDSSYAAALREVAHARGLHAITTGRAAGDIRIEAARATPEGQEIDLVMFGEKQRVMFPVLGSFQADNLLVALGIVIGCGEMPGRLFGFIPRLRPVPGRLESIGRTARGGLVYVDYAHKPAGLDIVLRAVRAATAGKVWVVFGCGGDRDRAKRPLMGEIAGRLADRVIVTDDNPRSEDPAAIRAEILRGCPDATEIGDRAQAIAAAIAALDEADTLVIAGKGHETGQIVGKTVLPFDDAAVARHLLAGAEVAA